MEIENLIRYPVLAVGLKPSAIQGKARLRGTRTPTATLLAIAYRLSAIAYRQRRVKNTLCAIINRDS